MSYLKKYGRRLLDAGYDIVPLKPGEKHPNLKNWTQLDPRAEIDHWLDGPMQNWGVGIRTRNNPGIDIDCDDPDVVRDIYKAITGIIGPCRAYRIGRAPRILILCRTDEPFSKLRSQKYEHALLSTTHQVEILADGQQFAAYHRHPNTGRDYTWPAAGPAGTDSAALPCINAEQAVQILKAFEEIAAEKVSEGSWHAVSGSTAIANPINAEAFLLHHTSAKSVGVQEIEAALGVLSSEDYDRWLQVGMILHHQFSGGDDGYEIWHDWSRTASTYTSEDDCRYRWDGFTSDTRGSTVTIGTLFHWANEARQEQAADSLAEVERIIAGCESFTDLLGGRVAGALRDWLDMYPLLRDRVVDLVKRRGRVLSGSPVSIQTVRAALKSKKKTEKSDTAEMYPWAEPFVYLADEDKFFNVETRSIRSRTAFDADFNRLFAEDKDSPSAARVALEQARIRVVEGARYMPGSDPVFTMEGFDYANRYNPDSAAAVPETLSVADNRARRLFARHVQTLIADETDRRVFIDFLTYVVQNPGKRVNYSILLQGQEGDGKSFFATLMAMILGPSNCKSIPGTALEKEFTGWAEGSQLTFIEEIKLHGVSGYDILNKFKPYVTNETVTVRRMQRDHYNVPNVTSYVLFTNFRNALPLDETDSRYYPIFSRWGSEAEFAAWKAENPDFFAELYEACAAAPGAIRKFFLERDISADFNPRGRAPMNANKREMARLSRDEQMVHIDDIIELVGKGEYGKNTELLSSTWLMWNWGFDGSQIARPATSKFTALMLRHGWSVVSFVTDKGTETNRISVNHRNHRFWARPSGLRPSAKLSSIEVSLKLDGSYGECPI